MDKKTAKKDSIKKAVSPKKSVKKAASKPSKKVKLNPESFFVIKTGGKQYKVASGDILKIEKIKGVKVGDKISFDEVLFSYDGKEVKVGTPKISGKKVEGEVLEEGRGKKVVVIKYKQKSRYFKNRGHRQPFIKVKIN